MPKKSTSILDKSCDMSNHERLWERAIADAEELIKDSQKNVRELRRSIAMFKRLRDSGAAFPGTTKGGVA
jgi:hypothetical protein